MVSDVGTGSNDNYHVMPRRFPHLIGCRFLELPGSVARSDGLLKQVMAMTEGRLTALCV